MHMYICAGGCAWLCGCLPLCVLCTGRWRSEGTLRSHLRVLSLKSANKVDCQQAPGLLLGSLGWDDRNELPFQVFLYGF